MTLTGYNYKTPGHILKECKQLTKKSDKSSRLELGKSKWYSYHCSNDHSNEDCYQQQLKEESVNFDTRKNGATILIAVAVRMTNVTPRNKTANLRNVLSMALPVKSRRRSSRTVPWPALISSNVAVTIKSKRSLRKRMTNCIRHLVLDLVSALAIYLYRNKQTDFNFDRLGFV